MAKRAYVLVTAVPNRIPDTIRAMRALPGVQSVDAVTGPYDVIAVVSGADVDEIGRLVVNRVQAIDGVDRTLTCLAIGVE